ncbi:homoserine dehydrogenase [Bacillus sp. FJAT-49736]|uniref:homoserine dehydrogenase n=1 Tax=Bacillus sp. FJAT-49736 TaxID=2833582 RepID=UPI001BC91323|nr:homoserine dehydrogenase [Bacillus sp. FJAT-49736]MBS4174114.1 homoserine dehydrogenase [Bacillus sp. FJAT-49736]
MSRIKAALLGYGTVGQGVYTAIKTHGQQLKKLLGAEVEIAGVLIKDPHKKRDIDPGILITTEFDDILKIPDLQVIFEAIVGEEPSFSYLNRAIENGIQVITANKVMFARHGKALLEKGREHGVRVGYEATTAGGVPIIRTLKQLLQVNQIERIQGILNGTCNFILTEMRNRRLTFEDALKLAQLSGFAEVDPTSDISGKDAFCKTMILSELAFGRQPEWSDVELEGITDITNDQVEEARFLNLRYKHIAEIFEEEGVIRATIRPVLLGESHPFYSVEGVDNAITVETSLLGRVTLQGPGAGKLPTASAMVEDLADIFKTNRRELQTVYK